MISTSHFHPMLVHFPIALVVFGFMFYFASLIFKKEAALVKTATYLLIVGTLTAIVALLSGILFTSELSGAAGEAQETHEMFAWVTVGILSITSLLRLFVINKNKSNSALKWLEFVLYGLAAASVSITGFFGGSLVYNFMMPL
jgi:uncharacterized membrane protein